MVWVGLALLALLVLSPANLDDIFLARCRGIPLEYVRALAYGESRMNPNEQKGDAWGVLQVATVVRESYNKWNRTDITRQQLLDPDINAKIACWQLGRVEKAFRGNHPKAFPRGIGWSSRRYALLVTYGWNAGHSEAAGVGYVVGVLEKRGYSAEQITIDRVYEAALTLPRASRHLKRADKVAFCKSVVNRYFSALRRPGV